MPEKTMEVQEGRFLMKSMIEDRVWKKITHARFIKLFLYSCMYFQEIPRHVVKLEIYFLQPITTKDTKKAENSQIGLVRVKCHRNAL